MALLAVSLTATAPVLVGPKGWLVMDADRTGLKAIPGGGIQSRTFSIPSELSLTGLLITAQVYDAATGLTRPVTASVLP